MNCMRHDIFLHYMHLFLFVRIVRACDMGLVDGVIENVLQCGITISFVLYSAYPFTVTWWFDLFRSWLMLDRSRSRDSRSLKTWIYSSLEAIQRSGVWLFSSTCWTMWLLKLIAIASHYSHVHCVPKTSTFLFFKWLSQKLTDFNYFWCVKSWENLTSTACTFAYLTCIL